MKSVFKFLSLMLIAATVVFASCSKDDNPVDNDLFIGTYHGSVSYTGDKTITNSNGSVTVVKVGDRYDFNFSDNIPSIKDVQMSKGEQGYIGTVNGYTGLLSIDAGKLHIALKNGDNTWGADCNR
ncbi:hypothetical protein A8C56_15650 [Niabella ginsenosidivorans]|uniref:Lipoprotein n=1 Tax=Niabella ginsenosidivorans TaxID=1176587 RepID=A0A1A9I3F8_9BACT|nr:hypothetical protein [Niabella ginsenosidivorans]ANH82207.1 hypothetical protein A8C56_15650 [Niabella ginsenosidivorans]